MSTTTEGAVVVRADEAQRVAWGPAGTIRVVAGADSTAGTFSVCEVVEEPGSAAPLHVHHGEAEAFYILEGALELTCGDETLTANAGDFVHTPKDVPHKYAVVGDRPARVLLFFSRPGFERFFLEAGQPLDAAPTPPDPNELKRIVESYGMELLEVPGH